LYIRGLALCYYFIPMENFIKLLNEYTKQSYDDYSFFKYIEYTHSFYVSDDGYESYMPEEVILGKKFGFISRLVKNDKIDRHSKNLEPDMKRIRIPQNYYISWGQSLDLQHKKAKYLDLTALLSIQDEPIKYLCEIIK